MAGGMTFSIKLPQTAKWVAHLDELQDAFAEQMVVVTRQAGQVALTAAQEFTPKATGETARLWKLVELGRGSHRGRYLGFTVTLDHPFNYQGATHPRTGKPVNRGDKSLLTDLEYGTKPHDIPVPGGILSFVDRATGDKVVRNLKNRGNIVKHPGTKAYGMLRKAAAISKRTFEDLAADMVDRLLAKLNQGDV